MPREASVKEDVLNIWSEKDQALVDGLPYVEMLGEAFVVEVEEQERLL